MGNKDIFDRAAADIIGGLLCHINEEGGTIDSQEDAIASYLRSTFDVSRFRDFERLIEAVGRMLDAGREGFRLGLGAEVLDAYEAATAPSPAKAFNGAQVVQIQEDPDKQRHFRRDGETKIDRGSPATYLAPFLHHDATLTDASRIDGYFPLETVLCAAYAQATAGKGKERHAAGDDFNDQPILTIGRLLKSADGEAYQAIKKLREGLMMHKRGQTDAAIRELLGAINYIAATAILLAEEGHARGIREFEDMQSK